MKIKENQKLLKQKFYSRIIVAFAAMIICVFSLMLDDGVLKTVILGISGSALAWSIVEIIDFFINTFDAYKDQRIKLLRIIFCHFAELKKFVRINKAEELDLEKVNAVIEKLMRDVFSFPFEGKVYSISSEFQQIANYVRRMYWKTLGVAHFGNDDYKKQLYNSLVKQSSEYSEIIYKRFMRDFANLSSNYEELAEIEIDFTFFSEPDIVRDNLEGNLHQSVQLSGKESGLVKSKTFKPDIDFEPICMRKVSILELFPLLFKSMKD